MRSGRQLNETRGKLGLNELDFAFIGLAFVGFASFASRSSVIVLAFAFAAGMVLVLRPIRMKYRRRIVRDFLRDSVERIYGFLFKF